MSIPSGRKEEGKEGNGKGKTLCHLLKSFPESLTKDLLHLIGQSCVM